MNTNYPKQTSTLNMLSGKISFSDEPLWYRLVVIIIVAAFLFSMAWLLKEWGLLPAVLQKLSGIRFSSLFKTDNGKSP